MSPPKKVKFDRQFTMHVTARTFQHLETLSNRQHTSVGDIVRQALREYLDSQDDVIGSRSRIGSRIKRQLEAMHKELLQQQVRHDSHLLAAIILLQMKQGAQGREVLEQVRQVVDHARDEIEAVLEGQA